MRWRLANCRVPASHEITIEIGRGGPNAVAVGSRTAAWASPKAIWSGCSSPSTRPSPAGLGIGLAICRKLIEAHGGALWAAHNPGGGAVFQFTLPGGPPAD